MDRIADMEKQLGQIDKSINDAKAVVHQLVGRKSLLIEMIQKEKDYVTKFINDKKDKTPKEEIDNTKTKETDKKVK